MNETAPAEQAHRTRAVQAELVGCMPLAATLRIEVASLDAGRIELRCPAPVPSAELGVAPVLAGLGECAARGLVIAAGWPGDAAAVLNLGIDVVREIPAAALGELRADGRILRQGKRLAVCEAVVREAGEKAPLAIVTTALSRRDGKMIPLS